MKKIEVFEVEDLKLIDGKLSHFIFGDNGFSNRNKLPTYEWSFKAAELLVFTERVKNGTEDDLKDLKQHLCKRLENSRQALKTKKEEVDRYERFISDMKSTLETISSKETFEDALKALI